MDIQQLKYFLAVSRTCNYTKATEEFFISRQAMAQSVRQLETQLQTPLFVKNKSSIKLTPMGEIEHGFEPTFSIISTDTQIAIRLVQQNRSISFGFSAFRYPSGMVDPMSPIRVLPLELNEPDEWGIYAITRRNEAQTILQKILIEYLLSAQAQPLILQSL